MIGGMISPPTVITTSPSSLKSRIASDSPTSSSEPTARRDRHRQHGEECGRGDSQLADHITNRRKLLPR